MAKRDAYLQQGQTTLQSRIAATNEENAKALGDLVRAVCSGPDCECLLTGACDALRSDVDRPLNPHY